MNKMEVALGVLFDLPYEVVENILENVEEWDDVISLLDVNMIISGYTLRSVKKLVSSDPINVEEVSLFYRLREIDAPLVCRDTDTLLKFISTTASSYNIFEDEGLSISEKLENDVVKAIAKNKNIVEHSVCFGDFSIDFWKNRLLSLNTVYASTASFSITELNPTGLYITDKMSSKIIRILGSSNIEYLLFSSTNGPVDPLVQLQMMAKLLWENNNSTKSIKSLDYTDVTIEKDSLQYFLNILEQSRVKYESVKKVRIPVILEFVDVFMSLFPRAELVYLDLEIIDQGRTHARLDYWKRRLVILDVDSPIIQTAKLEIKDLEDEIRLYQNNLSYSMKTMEKYQFRYPQVKFVAVDL